MPLELAEGHIKEQLTDLLAPRYGKSLLHHRPHMACLQHQQNYQNWQASRRGSLL